MPSGALRSTSRRAGDWADGIAEAIERAGDAWSWLVLYEAIVCGVRRFDEFQRHLGIARSTLTARLESLGASGLLVKSNRATVAKPEYRPSDAGTAFTACLLMAMNWGDRWEPAPGGSPLLVEHIACGSRDGVEIRCASCARPVVARDVTFEKMPPPPVPTEWSRARTPGLELLERNGPSSIARTLKVTGDRWSSLVLRGAFFGLRRFDEFERALGIAPNILSQRLVRLVENDVLRKEPYMRRPLRYEYRLTDKGLDLYPMYLAMLAWSGSRPGDLRLRHLPCSAELRPVTCCIGCGAEVDRDALRFHQMAGHEDVIRRR